MLKVGLLWFDDDTKRALTAKLDEAAERYEERFGVRPTLVYLNPAQAEGAAHRRLRLFGDPGLRRNYFLVGIDEADVEAESQLLADPVVAAPDVGRQRPARAARSRRVPSLASVTTRRVRPSRRAS
jgi:hypothetical protein